MRTDTAVLASRSLVLKDQSTIRIRQRCPQCDALGTVHLQQVIRGPSVHLSWECTGCQTEWDTAAEEPLFSERRIGLPDRRKLPRTDRRIGSPTRHRTDDGRHTQAVPDYSDSSCLSRARHRETRR
jgi:hypothetical protein